MSTGTVTPSGFQQEIDANGDPISGALIYTYLAGTTTPVATYTTVNVSGGSAVPNSNPIQADSAGRWVAFLTPGVSYKYLYCLPVTPIPPPSAPPSAYKTVDNITAVPSSTLALDVPGILGETVIATNLLYLSDGSGGKTAGKWYLGSSLNSYSSTTPEMGFAVSGGDLNDVVFIRQGGQVTGLSGLSVGASYYVGTAGLITATPSTNSRFVGQADTTISLIASPNPPVATTGDNAINDFRLTLTTGVAVTVTNVTGATTLFCAPYTGNRIALYDSTGIATIYASPQFSIAVPATMDTLYDVFAYANAGVPTLELLAWTSLTARATAIVQTTTGAWTKSGDLTRRYLGSMSTTGISGQTEDSVLKRYVWNFYNRAPRIVVCAEGVPTWTYQTNVWRQANANPANQVDVVIGVAGVMLELDLTVKANNSAGGAANAAVNIGEDSITVPLTTTLFLYESATTAGTDFVVSARLKSYPAVGRHYYAWLEIGAPSGTTTWNNGFTFGNGMYGAIQG